MELLDVVNDKDEIIGKADIKKAHAEKLLHRIVHVLIMNHTGEMALQMRSAQRHFCPQHWCTAVGGHVQSGETYEQAAIRECREEIGTTIPKMKKTFYDLYRHEQQGDKFLTTFVATYDGPFYPNPEEVEKIVFFKIEKIKDMIKAGEKFHPELLFLLNKHL
ncbi:MAG: NUDIX domain-containing protein [Patescibacteria group bacterium]|jgi:isopentenyldiphosphate isomerase